MWWDQLISNSFFTYKQLNLSNEDQTHKVHSISITKQGNTLSYLFYHYIEYKGWFWDTYIVTVSFKI